MVEVPSGPYLPFRQVWHHALGYPILELPADERIAPPLPTVVIALGSETAQLRAERVFLYSILKHRDPRRTYVIHVLRDLPGFAGHQWRTGFTNYRFAIPSLVAGKAIYNDVDQIYLDDPAKLFDLPLGEAGFLALSADDTAVMLLDSERMRPFWNLETARHTAKRKPCCKEQRAPCGGRCRSAGMPGIWNTAQAIPPCCTIRCFIASPGAPPRSATATIPILWGSCGLPWKRK